MSMPLMVCGATGKQGGALISALLHGPSQPFELYAVTRDKSSSAAQKLASQPQVHVIEGSFGQPAEIFKQVKGQLWGLFLVTTPMGRGGAKKEEQEGKAVIKAALDAGVKHIVFTSVDRGLNSDTDPTNVPHFVSKKNIEDDIKERTKTLESTTWTFLRPVAFLENFSNDFLGKMFFTTWKLNGPDAKLQFVSTKDIGRVAADAFLSLRNDPSSRFYRNRSISLAGDTLSPNSAAQIFQATTGQEIPTTYSFMGSTIKWMLDDLGKMMDWFKDVGYNNDIEALRKTYPFLKDFKTWLQEESAWRKK